MKTAAQHLWEMVLLHDWGAGTDSVQRTGDIRITERCISALAVMAWERMVRHLTLGPHEGSEGDHNYLLKILSPGL